MFLLKKPLMICCLVGVLFSSCSSPLLPEPRLPKETRQELPDISLIDALRSDWDLLKQPKLDMETRTAAYHRYNDNLLILMRRIRHDYNEAKDKGDFYQAEVFTIKQEPEMKNIKRLRDLYDDIVPSCDIPLESVEERVHVEGIGVPVVGVIPSVDMGKLDGVTPVRSQGTVRTMTAMMLFPEKSAKDQRPVLKLISSPRQQTVEVGKMRYQLALEPSASLEVYWNLTGVKEWRFLGLLNPQELRDVTGLSCIEQYNPDRIPVILTHGLASDPSTFINLVNRLLKNPDIAKHYQFWYFGYPTGVAWVTNSKAFRDSLTEARDRLDPTHSNKNWDKMVLLGHSMGGLITHFSQCEEPWRMLESVMTTEAVKKYLNPNFDYKDIKTDAGRQLYKTYFFEPVKASRVIYLATPHRGAPMASYGIVQFFIKLIHLPETVMSEAVKLLTLNEDIFILKPEALTEWFTSVNQLAANSSSIQGLSKLKVRDVPTHSIIGDRGRGDTPKSSDGIVPYWSSHLPWGTEAIVPTGHSVQDIPETAELVRDILLEHLKENL